METGGRTSHSQALNIESGSTNKEEQIQEHGRASAHTIGLDSWKQVGVMLVTGFNCGWILSFSNLIMIPLGWAWAIPSLVIVAFCAAYANWLLADFHFIEGQRFIRYKDLMGFYFGKKMYYLTMGMQFFTFVLANMGFILLGGRALKEINMALVDSTLRLQYLIVITGVAYFIFSFVVPNLSSMRNWLWVSSILTLSYIGFLVAIVVMDGKSKQDQDYEVVGSPVVKVLNAFGAISAILVTNTTGMLPEIQSTLRKPEVKNMRKALYVQYTLGWLVYHGVTVLGYWAYGSKVSEYLPNQLSGPNWVKILINSLVFLQNIVSQHMFVQPVHEALDSRFLMVDESKYSRQNLIRRFFLRAFLFSGNTLVAAAIPFMGDFINLLGSFTLVPLTFIFPSMVYIKVKGKTTTAGKKIWHWTIIVVSSLLAVFTTISAMRLIILNITTYQFFANA